MKLLKFWFPRNHTFYEQRKIYSDFGGKDICSKIIKSLEAYILRYFIVSRSCYSYCVISNLISPVCSRINWFPVSIILSRIWYIYWWKLTYFSLIFYVSLLFFWNIISIWNSNNIRYIIFATYNMQHTYWMLHVI